MKLGNQLILNRENNSLPADKWYMVARKGEHPISIEMPNGKNEPFLQIVDDASTHLMANRFAADKAKDPTLELLVDQDHFSDDIAKPSQAFGWIQNLENRDDGLWGQISWTAAGEAAVKDKTYRFLSPVWTMNDCEKLPNRGLRPLRLAKAAVTNSPNIKGMAPLKNRQQVPDTGRKESSMDHKTQLLQMLGLAADATDEQITAAQAAHVNACKNRETEITTLTNRIKELEAKELDALVEKDLDLHKDKISNRAEMKVALLANRAPTLKFLESLVAPASGQKLMNRENGKAPEGVANEEQKATDRQALVDSIKLKNRCTSTEAWAQASRIKPELFK